MSDLAPTQVIIDRACKSNFKANSKYKTIQNGGAAVENLFSRLIAAQLSYFQKQLLNKSEYYLELNNFLQKNVNLNLEFLFNHGLKMMNLIKRILELLQFDRIVYIVEIYKKKIISPV